MSHVRTRTLRDAGKMSSNTSPSDDKRNILWKAFRKTVLEPHGINILENAAMEHVPETLLQFVQEMCQDLHRHAERASAFREAVVQGRGFDSSTIFPSDTLPSVNAEQGLTRRMEAAFNRSALPSLHSTLFELPVPRPLLTCGFSSKALGRDDATSFPEWVTVVGDNDGNTENQPNSHHVTRVPFLMFERTYGHARHEIEAAVNHCAIDGAVALHALSLLYDRAGLRNDCNLRGPHPVVFTCTIDDNIGILHHHWIDAQNMFNVAPLCEFDLRDTEHFMQFLAWIEAIEKWAVKFLLPDVKAALDEACGTNTENSLPAPVATEEKAEEARISMKLTFDNIPWRAPGMKGVPLAATATMRMRSPKAEEVVDFSGGNDSSSPSMRSPVSGNSPTGRQTSTDKTPALPASAQADVGDHHQSTFAPPASGIIASTQRASNNALPLASSGFHSQDRGCHPTYDDIDTRSQTVPDTASQTCSPATTNTTLGMRMMSEHIPWTNNSSPFKDTIAPTLALNTNDSTPTKHLILPRSYSPAVQILQSRATSVETTPVVQYQTSYVGKIPLLPASSSQQQSPVQSYTGSPMTRGLACVTNFPGVHNHASTLSPQTVISARTPLVIASAIPRTALGKEPFISLATHAVSAQPPFRIPSPSQSQPQPHTYQAITPPPISVSPVPQIIRSKQSLPSLHQQKRVRSPDTPEVTGNSSSATTAPTSTPLTGASPKTTSTSTFRSKLTNSLGMIKEHTKAKRVRMDNSAPPKPIDGPLLTPAYDKRRFQTPESCSTSPRNGEPESRVRTPGTAGTVISTGTMAVSPPPPSWRSTPVQKQTIQIQTQSVVANTGSSNYLPLRNYMGGPEGMKGQIVTTGPV